MDENWVPADIWHLTFQVLWTTTKTLTHYIHVSKCKNKENELNLFYNRYLPHVQTMPSLPPPTCSLSLVPHMFIVPLNGKLKFYQWLKCLVCRANLWLTQHWPQSNRLGVGMGRVLRWRKRCNIGPFLSTFSCLLYKSTNRWWYMLGGTLLCPIRCNHVHKLLCRWNLCNAPANCHRSLGINNWLFCIAIDLRLRKTRGWLLCHWGTKLRRSVPQR